MNENIQSSLTGASVQPTQYDAIHMAAKSLGRLPKDLVSGRRRKQRKWTGFIGKVRAWVGLAVILPNGTTGWIKRVVRGVAIVQTANWHAEGYFLHEYWFVSSLRIAKNPDAVALGAQKRRIIERKSELKAQAARRNGAKSAGRGKKIERTSRGTGQIVF